MSHPLLHFSTGHFCGTALMLLNCFRWKNNSTPSKNAIKWIIISILLGAWGLLPNIIQKITGYTPDAPPDWYNLFWGYAEISKIRPGGGMVIGGILMLFSISLQYLVIVWLIAKAKSKPLI